MSIEQALAENTAAIRELIAKLATAAPIPQAEPEKTSAKATTTTKTVDAEKTTAADPKPTVEYLDIQKLVPQIALDGEGTEKVKALFARFGVKRGPELKPEQYASFYADLLSIKAGELDPRTAEA